jgi:hypothetical protein
MTQAVNGRAFKKWLWIPLAGVAGVVVAVLQGLLVFAWQDFPGSFFSMTGFKCIAVPLFVEAVIAVVALKSLDELHLKATANPHSPLSQALRNDGARPSAPPTRDAWKGGFEEMDEASDKMSKGR